MFNARTIACLTALTVDTVVNYKIRRKNLVLEDRLMKVTSVALVQNEHIQYLADMITRSGLEVSEFDHVALTAITDQYELFID
jgi:hypothetical protein